MFQAEILISVCGFEIDFFVLLGILQTKKQKNAEKISKNKSADRCTDFGFSNAVFGR